MNSPKGQVLGALLCAAALAGCATRADLVSLEQEQRQTRALVADHQIAIDGLRRRVDMLRGEVGGSGGARRGSPVSAEMVDQLRELQARVAALEQARSGIQPPSEGVAPVLPPVEGAPPPEVAQPPAPVSRGQAGLEAAVAKEQAALQGGKAPPEYGEALQMIRQGQCSQAVPKLREFLRKNPKSDLADNAQNWIGTCYYVQKDYNRAIIELNEVLLKYPKGDAVPPALLTLADAFADSGDKIDARLILQKLVADHPRSPEAEIGRQRLQALGN
jgi:tol-pal system protein YbgF